MRIWVLAAWRDLTFVATNGLPDLSCCLHIMLCVSRIVYLFNTFWYITVTLGFWALVEQQKCLFVYQNYSAGIFVCFTFIWQYCGAFYNEFNISFWKDDFFVYPDMGLGSLKRLAICGDHFGLPDLSCCLHIVLCVSRACVYFISFDK